MKKYLPPSRSDLRQDGDVTVISIINNKTCTKYKNIRSIHTIINYVLRHPVMAYLD
jgi:hypothetical protein